MRGLERPVCVERGRGPLDRPSLSGYCDSWRLWQALMIEETLALHWPLRHLAPDSKGGPAGERYSAHRVDWEGCDYSSRDAELLRCQFATRGVH